MPLFLSVTLLCDLESLFVIISSPDFIQEREIQTVYHWLSFLFPVAYFPCSLHSHREAYKYIILEEYIY